jgi:hypothetical protein
LRKTVFATWAGNCINARRTQLGGATRIMKCLFVLAEPSLGDR